MADEKCGKVAGLGAVPKADVTVDIGDVTVDIDETALADAIANAFADVTLDVNVVNGPIEVTISDPLNVIVESQPTWLPGCVDFCNPVWVCVVKSADGSITPTAILDAAGSSSSISELPEGFALGSCSLPVERCVKMLTPNEDGDFVCESVEFTITTQGSPNKIVAWHLTDMIGEPIPDPREGLVAGVDYYLVPCSIEPVAMSDIFFETVVIPLDVNAEENVNGNVLNGSVELSDVCSLSVKAFIDPTCEDGAAPPTSVTWIDAAGNSHTQFVPAGCEECFDCLGESVIIDGFAAITATTTTTITSNVEDC